MSIWHNKAIPTTEKDKYVYVEFYTQIPYTDRETKSRCITPASDCEGIEEPDLIRWCYLDDLLNQQAEIDRLREMLKTAKKVLKFYADENNFGSESSLDYIYERNPESDLYEDFRDVGWYAKETLKALNGESLKI